MRVFIWGLGYTGLGISNVLLQLPRTETGEPGCVVSGTCRSEEKAQSLRKLGIDAHVFNVDSDDLSITEDAKDALLASTHILSTIPPIWDFNTDPVLSLHKEDVSRAQWKGYLSTTGVYGDYKGDWVTEESACLAPESSPAFSRLAVENKWLDMGGCIFRLAGIYGPGRSALTTMQRKSQRKIAAGRANTKIEADGDTITTTNYVNRIHVADIASAVVKCMTLTGNPREKGAIYNLADDYPAPRGEVMAYAEELLGKGRDSEKSDGAATTTGIADVDMGGTGVNNMRARRRASEHKRVNNARMRQQLMPGGLRYPSYREGLRAIHHGDTSPFQPS
jgi:nucleoside-diphosphate-sugar epimerase